MSSILGYLLMLLLAITISHAIPDIHKQMSPHQLQSVFHVAHIDAVPQYEVIQLLHQSTNIDSFNDATSAHNRRRRRTRRSIDNSKLAYSKLKAHHVKKDLSKKLYRNEWKKSDAFAERKTNHLLLSDIKQHNVSFCAFGENRNLTLRPTEGLFKSAPNKLRMWTVSSKPNATHGLDLQEISDEELDAQTHIGEVYQDEANMAAILMRRHMETGDLIMEGSVGNYVIKPLPHGLAKNKEEVQHVIYKREVNPLEHLSDFAFMEPDDLASSEKLESLQNRHRRSAQPYNFKDFEDLTDDEESVIDAEDAYDEETLEEQTESRKRAKRQAPYVIYPEVLVIVDYDGYRLHGGDNLQVKRYFISFWNGVDLRYRLLKGPKIRISIAGIIISRGRDATPYLERNRVGRDAIDSAAALTDMGKYLFRERRLPVYDIAVAITKLDMCRRNSEYDECNRGTAGFAYVGGACVVNKRLEKVNSVAIIEDTGGFSGIIVAAHEVGHLLGAVHDGSPPPSYLGGPGAQRCRWEDGYIMSDLRHTERGFRWSPCTVQSFHHFLNGETATCLHNPPHEDAALGRNLPGTLLSLDAQCRRDRGTYACFKDERVCSQLFCFDAQTGYCVAYRPAAEGSICGNGMHCLDGHCAPLPSNIIPDYGNQYGGIGYNKHDNRSDDKNVTGSEEIESDDEFDEYDEEQEQDIDDDDEGEADDVEGEGEAEDNDIIEGKLNENLVYDNKIESTFMDQINSAALIHANTNTTEVTNTTTTPILNANTTLAYLTNVLLQNGGIIVKTSKSSSVSSSYGDNNTKQNETNTTRNTNTNTSIKINTTTKQPSILQIYTQAFRKQFEYYIDSITQQQQKHQHQHEQTHQQKQKQKAFSKNIKFYNQQHDMVEQNSTLTSNYSVTNINNKSQTQNNNNEGNEGNNSDEDNNAEDEPIDLEGENIANNEAIGKQKRKFLNNEKQQHYTTTLQQQLVIPIAPPTRSGAIVIPSLTPTTARTYYTGGRSTSTAVLIPTTTTTMRNFDNQQQPPTTTSFFDAYFKKLQTLQFATSPPIVTAKKTTSLIRQQQKQQQLREDYGNAFLKRTQNSNNKNINNNNHQTYHYHQQNHKVYQEVVDQQEPQQLQQPQQQEQQQQQQQQQYTSPAYVTNYIGDNTNHHLEAVIVPPQETYSQHDNTRTATISSAIQQQHQQHSTASTRTFKNKKIKTQKLIRRPLRTQIK